MAYPYSTYPEADVLASLPHLPPTPAVYSGYTSPAESFSPLSLAYSGFSSQPVYSPLSQPMSTQLEQQQQQQQPPAAFRTPPCAASSPPAAVPELPYLPAPRVPGDSFAWEPHHRSSALLDRHTAPPTPEDFACSIVPNNGEAPGAAVARDQKEGTAYQPVIVDDSGGGDESEGEILYGMGLYDPPDHGKRTANRTASALGMLHRSAIYSLLGSRDREEEEEEEEESDTGEGLGLKLEDAWEPPASDGEEEEEGGVEDADADGEGQEE